MPSVPLTPEDVEKTEFSPIKFGRRGYDEGEVDDFLEKVADALRELRAENQSLSAKIAELESRPQAEPSSTPAETATGILAMAQRTAEEHVADARATAQRMVDEARQRSEQMSTEADVRERRVLGELEQSKATLERRIEALHAFEREYRSRLKAYLESQLQDLEARADAAGGPIDSSGPSPSAGDGSTPPVGAAGHDAAVGASGFGATAVPPTESAHSGESVVLGDHTADASAQSLDQP